MGEGSRRTLRGSLRSARGAATLACLVGVAAVTACGGSSGSNSSSTAIQASAAPSRPAATDAPPGTASADLGFRPEKDGFAFDNYGNETAPANLTAAEVRAIFGDQVCANLSGGTCDLIPPAKKWMDEWNIIMAGGHCYGFSVTALLLYRHQLDPTTFGAPSTDQLKLDGNQALQRRIAESFAYQGLDSVQSVVVTGTPNDILNKLASVLSPSSTEVYTLGIRKADGTGGHAVTPYALIDRGNGVTAILVYDNNWHGVAREVDVDRNANTWKYTASTNPSETSSDYSGDASTQTMALYPTSPASGGVRPCPFCGKSATAMRGDGGVGGAAVLANYNTGFGSLQYDLGASDQDPNDYDFIAIKAIDARGGVLGFSGGKPVDTMSNAEADPVLLGEPDWQTRDDPRFRLGERALHVVLDGSEATSVHRENLDLTGPDGDLGVDQFAVPPGAKPAVDISEHGDAVRFTSAGGSDPPDLYTAISALHADYTFDATPQNLGSGDALTLGYIGDMVVVDGRGLHSPTTVKLDVEAANEAGDIQASANLTVVPGSMMSVDVSNYRPDASHDLPAAADFTGTPGWQFVG